MATKISNNHLYKILNDAKKYYTPDVFLVLVNISTQVADTNGIDRFIIQTGNDKKRTLIKVLCNFLSINRQTIVNCLNEIESLGLLEYNNNINAWELVEMVDFLKKGYTPLNESLLSAEFTNLKLREKKLYLYMTHLKASKGSEKFSSINEVDFVANLNEKNSMWRKILSKSSKPYYAKYSFQKFLTKMKNFIENKTEDIREKDFRPKEIKDKIFYFNAIKFKNSNNKYNEIFEISYKNELAMIRSYLRYNDVTLSIEKIYQIAHSIGTLSSWQLKEYIARSIVKKYIAIQKYGTREDIKSLPAYIAAIIKTLINNYNEFIKGKDLELDSIKTNIELLAF